jgi:phage tail-like protein
MNAPLRIPHIPTPPFEPTSLLLNARVGWRVEEGNWSGVESDAEGMLQLTPDPASARDFTEPGGSFGGLVPPRHVAIGPDGTVYLLDRAHHLLKRFDPCRCEFVAVPCIGGEGGDARQWRGPRGIAIGCGKLYVCDTGLEEATPPHGCVDEAAALAKLARENHRVSVFSLNGLALHGHLKPRGVSAWRPTAVALDENGQAYVTDALNGMVHVFSPMLRFVRSIPGFVNPGAIAIDCRGFRYVLCAVLPHQRMVRVVDANGQEQPVPRRVDEMAQWFMPLPFGVDAQGRLDLHALCVGNHAAESLVFDASGEPVLPEPAAPVTQYVKQGTVLIGPLDSKTQACIWHRVLLQGQLPQGSGAEVDTFSAEEIIPSDQLADFARWETGQIAHSFEAGHWDCLTRSGPGRYLWLRLALHGNGTSTPRIASIELEFPRIGSRRYLPAVFSAEASSADFTDRFLALFDTTLRGIERTVDTSPSLFDPLSAPAERVNSAPIDFLGWLASWVGLGFDRSWSEARRRAFLKRAGYWLDRRGTLRGLRDALTLLLGLDRGAACVCPDEPVTRCASRPANCAPKPAPVSRWQVPPLVLEHFRVRRWLFLGHGRLGERAVLWGQRIINRSQLDMNAQADVTQLVARPDPLRDPFHSHAHQFTVFVPSCVRDNDAQRKALENLLAADSPAHTCYYIEYVEPRFRIGVQSTLGFDAVVAAPPPVVALGDRPLGHGVLGEPPRERDGGRKLELGTRSRVGISTRIN